MRLENSLWIPAEAGIHILDNRSLAPHLAPSRK